uniref:Uncharacterized protein n=1 Tax=Mandrillus leucophaeus TaxID=9568 RepID=A0A2K5Z2A0_MANLE
MRPGVCRGLFPGSHCWHRPMVGHLLKGEAIDGPDQKEERGKCYILELRQMRLGGQGGWIA